MNLIGNDMLIVSPVGDGLNVEFKFTDHGMVMVSSIS